MGNGRRGDVIDVDVVRGCLLGGAIGDALGAGIEFDDIARIREAHGPRGISGFVPAYSRTGAITDDTQMTLFTLEGVIRSSVRSRSTGLTGVRDCVFHAYLRWYWTQTAHVPADEHLVLTGWLFRQPELRHSRAPGNTCLSALGSGTYGTTQVAHNDSKGCGGVMRAAPAGFAWQPPDAFETGADVAALTHGHPTGWLTAAVLAATVSGLVDGLGLGDALDEARALLRQWPAHEETDAALEWAVSTAPRGLPDPEEIDGLNRRGSAGWVAEETLGIAVRCALAAELAAGGRAGLDAEHVRDSLLASVNHSGDSDSTGAVAGNLLGALVGTAGLPVVWVEQVEAREVIDTIASDFVTEFGPQPPGAAAGPPGGQHIPEEWWARYPGT